MTYNYEVIAKMAADISKQMLKLNNQLDKIIDKQNELTEADVQQALAIELITALKWDEAAKLCTEQGKEEGKRVRLAEDETLVRNELEALRDALVGVSTGAVTDSNAASQAGEPDSINDDD
jgi:hypothetical protein